MKRGGLALALVLAVGGLLRVTGPGSSASREQGTSSGASSGTAATTGSPKEVPKDQYLKDFADQIQASYGVWGATAADTADLAAHLNVPVSYQGVLQREKLQFVLAILPDPVHTRLGLLFDRGVEAVQQAAQKSGYFFERAIMPWARTPPADFADYESKWLEAQDRKNREMFPGLMIFRHGGEPQAPQDAQKGSQTSQAVPNYGVPLFVLVIAETPTGGINKRQFRNAVEIINKIRGGSGSAVSAKNQQALILGPTFSGSLESLNQALLEPNARNTFGETFVYSGTTTDEQSIDTFKQQLSAVSPKGQFVSFQENDGHLLAEFLAFVHNQCYELNEVAVLSEGDTAYGKRPGRQGTRPEKATPTEKSDNSGTDSGTEGPLFLHFPREISYFRSVYLKETAAQPRGAIPGAPALTLELEDTGSDDDVVVPYAASPTTASQEGVMLGIVGELHKHQIAFTVVFATDPVDQLFLARYLRSGYPKGRVVVTSPDLLFAREEDNLLHGVLGLNTYPLVAGLDDQLFHYEPQSDSGSESFTPHEDKLAVSSLSVGTFNAMLGLLFLPYKSAGQSIPPAPYQDYGTPLNTSSKPDPLATRPPVWLTILGRDGFWPIACLDGDSLDSACVSDPAKNKNRNNNQRDSAKAASPAESTLQLSPCPAQSSQEGKCIDGERPQTPTAWRVAYALCLILMFAHFWLSWRGSILKDSETRAQFAATNDCRHAIIVAIGALCLAVALVVLVCARNPAVNWAGCWVWKIALWVPLLLFVAVVIWDLARRRGQSLVAVVFVAVLGVTMVLLLIWAFAVSAAPFARWPTRFVAVASGASPALPPLLLLGAGYWWMWQSLRGVTLVDLRRPRLPERDDLFKDIHHIGDDLGEKLREVAHPFFFIWQAFVLPLVLLGLALVVIDGEHPVQTVEGVPYDWAYFLLFASIVATLLGCLIKLVLSWFKCRQVLVGLDRLPLREAFSRMKVLSWHSMWNPGGSTYRETYRVMSRALETLDRLDRVLEQGDPEAPFTAQHSEKVRGQIEETRKAREAVYTLYKDIEPLNGAAQASLMPNLLAKIEELQKQMAKTAAVVMTHILKLLWEDDCSPVVSEEQGERKELPLSRVLAEEYVALIYVNFLITVLLRMRTMVICAAGLFVFIVLSVNVYPFEPHTALQTLCVILLIVSGLVVGYVYAGMHRDAILSRLTSSTAGELGWDFWLKFVSAGAIPLFSLLAAQFPSINQFLFSWLEPALQALK